VDIQPNQGSIQQSPDSYPPNQTFPNQYTSNDQPQIPEKKSNWGKTFLIVLIVLIVIVAGGYLVYKYYFIKNIAKSELNPSPTPSPIVETATVEGVNDKITVEIPSGYTNLSSDQFPSLFSGTSGTVVLNYANYQQGQDFNHAKLFLVVFMGENKDNDYKKGIEKMKTVLETLQSRDSDPSYQLEEVNINNYRLFKHTGKIKTGSYENSLTEYYIFTNKSYFVISRVNPLNEPNFAEEEFNQVLRSFKITPK